jgi:hypothetical protein
MPMNLEIVFREFLVVIVMVIVWIYGATRHKNSGKIPREMIMMPRPIAMLFGSLRPDGAISFPALIFQIIMFIFTLIISLENFGLMSHQEGYYYLFWSTMIVGLLILIFMIVKR